MTLRVAQFFLKIAHLSFSMGPRGPRAYGLRPRLWLLAVTHSSRSEEGRRPSERSEVYKFVAWGSREDRLGRSNLDLPIHICRDGVRTVA